MMHPEQVCGLLRAGEWTLADAHQQARAHITTPTKLVDAVMSAQRLPMDKAQEMVVLCGGSKNMRLSAATTSTIAQIESHYEHDRRVSPWAGWPWQPDPDDTEPT